MDDKKPSEIIQDFIEQLKAWSDEYDACKAIVSEEDGKIQDFLHGLEFQDAAKERSKIATIIHISRERRRIAKDRMELLDRVVMFFRKEQTKLFMKTLKILIADQQREEVRKAGKRTYTPRTSVWQEFPSCPLSKGGEDSDNN